METKAPEPARISEEVLRKPRPLPQDPVRERVVVWRSFRSMDEAIGYSTNILLSKSQNLVGGCCSDDIGAIYWVGVQVDDVSRWGNTKAIQMTDGVDGQNPDPPAKL